jgi:hypothetical protein
MVAPQNRRFYGKMECLPLWPTYIGEKGEDFVQNIWVRCYWEHPWGTHWEPWEPIGNLMRTHWKFERNMLRTQNYMFLKNVTRNKVGWRLVNI